MLGGWGVDGWGAGESWKCSLLPYFSLLFYFVQLVHFILNKPFLFPSSLPPSPLFPPSFPSSLPLSAPRRPLHRPTLHCLHSVPSPPLSSLPSPPLLPPLSSLPILPSTPSTPFLSLPHSLRLADDFRERKRKSLGGATFRGAALAVAAEENEEVVDPVVTEEERICRSATLIQVRERNAWPRDLRKSERNFGRKF